jgi:hypothetical protein
MKTIRLYASKDTTALSRHVQAWRTPSNPISQGRLSSGDFVDNSTVFFIGVCQAEKSIDEVKELLASDRQFAILLPTGLLPELSRGETSNGIETYNEDFEKQIYSLSKIVLSQEGVTWLVRIKDQPRIVEVLLQEHVGCADSEVATIISDSLLETLITQVNLLPDWHDHNREVSLEREVHNVGEAHSPPATRRSSRLKRHKSGVQPPVEPKSILEQPISGNVEPVEPTGSSSKSSNFNQFAVQSITSWIGNQLKDHTIPQSTLNGVIETHENYPDGGPSRIIVPLTEQENLVTIERFTTCKDPLDKDGWPRNFFEAMVSPDWREWVLAIKKEIASWNDFNAYTEIPFSSRAPGSSIHYTGGPTWIETLRRYVQHALTV